MKKTLIFLSLIAIQSWAATPAHESTHKTHETAAVCSGEKTEQCTSGEATHNEEHEGTSARMNSLFPQPVQNPSVTVRPLTVKLNAPAFLGHVSAGSVKLEWAASTGATGYHLQIATDSNFKWLVVNDAHVTGTSYDFGQAETGKTYFWRVAATNYANNSMYTKSLFVSSVFDVK